MVRIVRSWGLLALGLCALSAVSRAEQPGGFFDGSGGSAPAIAPEAFSAVRAAAATEAATLAPAQRSGADLYYFTREEAKAARLRFGIRARKPRTHGFVFDEDVPADIQKQMNADLAFIQSIAGNGATPFHQKIFGKVNGPDYIKFFNDRVTGIGMNGCGNGNAVACVIPMMDPSKMWLTQNFVKFKHPQVSRMMVVFHEARHTETDNDNWPHATCPTPFLDAAGKDMVSIWTGAKLAGEPACDVTPYGSYGSSTIMLRNIQKFCTNCQPLVKDAADLYAADQMGRITDPDAKRQMQEDFAK